jgi:exo-beta-1,3-glucanase (GH17 family)
VYVDENAYDGVKLQQTVSYRIRVNAVNGERMSDIENLDFSAQKMFVDLYPNPASDKVQLTMTPTETKGEAFLEIYGTDGRLVYRNAILPGSVKEQIDLASANVDSGSYTVHLVTSEEILDVRSLHVMR